VIIKKILKTALNFLTSPTLSARILSASKMPLRTRLQFIHNLDKIKANGWELEEVAEGGLIFRNIRLGYRLYARDTVAFTENLEEMYGLPGDIESILVEGSVVDVGAWIGDTVLFFLAKGYRKVVAYEPVPENIELIKFNLRLNNISEDRVEIRAEAVCERKGKQVIKSTAKPGLVAFGLVTGDRGETYELPVSCTTWDEVLKYAKKNNASLVKIDCEGCEKHLPNADPALVENIEAYIIEVHDPGIAQQLEALFNRKYYILERIIFRTRTIAYTAVYKLILKTLKNKT